MLISVVEPWSLGIWKIWLLNSSTFIIYTLSMNIISIMLTSMRRNLMNSTHFSKPPLKSTTIWTIVSLLIFKNCFHSWVLSHYNSLQKCQILTFSGGHRLQKVNRRDEQTSRYFFSIFRGRKGGHKPFCLHPLTP